MYKLILLTATLSAGCWGGYDGGGYRGGGGDGLGSFEVPSSDCSLVSTLSLSNSSASWNACRLRYDDHAQVYTWQFMTPNTTGSWTSQGAGWFTLSFNLNSPENHTLPLSDVTAELPPMVPLDEVVFAFAPTNGATVGAIGSVAVGSNVIYPTGDESSLQAQLVIDAVGFGTFTGSVNATIGTPVPGADAGTPECSDDGGCPDAS